MPALTQSAKASAALDASSPGFRTDVANHSECSLFAGSIFDGTAYLDNIAAVGGTSYLTALGAPHMVDVALAVPRTPKPRQFVVGTKFSAWVACGFLYVDKDRAMSPSIMAIVTAVQ